MVDKVREHAGEHFREGSNTALLCKPSSVNNQSHIQECSLQDIYLGLHVVTHALNPSEGRPGLSANQVCISNEELVL